MSRTGARDKARSQLIENLKVSSDCAALSREFRRLVEHVDTPEVVSI